MAKVCIWDGLKVRTQIAPLQIYLGSLVNCIRHLHGQMVAQDYPVYDVDVLIEYLIENQDEFIVVVGDSFIGLAVVQEEWHSPGKVLCEELVGPRVEAVVDLDDFMEAMKHTAVSLGCTEFLMGTLANPRKAALTRMLESKGMRLKTNTLSYKV